MNRVERGSGMNKEHFIIELKIYLKALNPKDQAIILAKYKALFDARVAEGETEEQVTSGKIIGETTGYRRRNFKRTRHRIDGTKN